MKNIITLMFVMGLIGCAAKPVVVVPSISKDTTKESPASKKELDKPKQTVEIDPELLKECDDFSKMTSKNPTPNQVLDQKGKDVATLSECRNRHRSLVKIVKDAFNIRE